MNITQLELALWEQLKDAVAHPEEVDVSFMAAELGYLATLKDIPLLEQLRLVAEAALQLSEICSLRSDESLSQWQQAHDPTEPVVDLSNTAVYLQTQHLDLSDFYGDGEDDPATPEFESLIVDSLLVSSDLSEVEPNTEATEAIESSAPIAPIVEMQLSKDHLIKVVEASLKHQHKDLASQIKDLAHDESISEWEIAIAQQLGEGPMNLIQLHQALDLSIVQLWLVALLGNFIIQPKESEPHKGYNPTGVPITSEQFYLSPTAWQVHMRQ